MLSKQSWLWFGGSDIGSDKACHIILIRWIGGSWRALTRKLSHHNLISRSQEAQGRNRCRSRNSHLQVAMKHLSSLVAVAPNLLGNWKSSNFHEFALLFVCLCFFIFHYISLFLTLLLRRIGGNTVCSKKLESRRGAIQDDYAPTHCGARAWWCKLQEAETKIQWQLVLDIFG